MKASVDLKAGTAYILDGAIDSTYELYVVTIGRGKNRGMYITDSGPPFPQDKLFEITGKIGENSNMFTVEQLTDAGKQNAVIRKKMKEYREGEQTRRDNKQFFEQYYSMLGGLAGI